MKGKELQDRRIPFLLLTLMWLTFLDSPLVFAQGCGSGRSYYLESDAGDRYNLIGPIIQEPSNHTRVTISGTLYIYSQVTPGSTNPFVGTIYVREIVTTSETFSYDVTTVVERIQSLSSILTTTAMMVAPAANVTLSGWLYYVMTPLICPSTSQRLVLTYSAVAGLVILAVFVVILRRNKSKVSVRVGCERYHTNS